MLINTVDVCIKQNRKRANSLPDHVILEQQGRFEMPLPLEAHQLSFICL